MRRALFLATVLANAAAAAPAITGLYRAGELGVVDMQTIEGRIVGRYRGGGSCGFKPDIQVISGNFEGGVFLGTVFVCQEGPSCEREKTFPFLAVYHDGALAGDVKLDVGCSSLGLEGRRLNIAMASSEDRFLIARDQEGSSASAIAAKNANKKENEKRAQEAFTEAQVKYMEKNLIAARSALERSITYDDSEWQPYELLGVVELQLNNAAKGLESLQKAVKLATNAKQHITDEKTGELFYDLACAYSRNARKRDAVNALRQAFKVGDLGSLLGGLNDERDLDSIREEPEFKRVVADAKANKDKRHR
jgi:hypothetical protein